MRKTISVVLNLATATDSTINIMNVNFTPDEMIIRSATLDPGANNVIGAVWCDITQDVLFSIATGTNLPTTIPLHLAYPVQRPIAATRFQFKTAAGALSGTIAGATLIFHIEFIKH